MKLDRTRRGDGPLVSGMTAGGFRVDDGIYPALLMTPQRADVWEPPAFEALDADALAAVLGIDPAPEFLLLGTGATLRQPPRALVRALDARGLGIEAMDSRAAARAWGVLRDEGRRIVAAFYPF
ncbi:MTH938/NDUFAF3 family protein [Sphingomonas sp. T9W2]|uniref:MTH938/NDUFAF3 family protein n=1 Tax=Sphingomonas sp. T9W2 TaxID=3143183 RepID=UPI0031F54877